MNNNSTKTLIQQSLSFINQNQLARAHKALTQADQISPNNIEIYHLLSVVFGMAEDYQQSETYCKKALAINNNAVVVYNNLGSVQKLQGKYDESIKSFKKAITIKNDYIDAYANLANLYLEIENIIDAEKLITRALKFDKKNLALNLALGNLRLKQENYQAATNIYLKVLDSQPNNTDAIINLGQIYEHLGKNENALKYYHKALEIIPGYDQSIIGITSILEKRGEFEEALNLIKPELKNSQNIKIHILCARIYSRIKNYTQGEKILLNTKNLFAIDQHKQELLYELGNIYDKQEKYDEAFATYVQANKINKFEFNREESQQLFDAIKSIYNSNTLEQLASSKNDSTQPLFIVGMPRSGTSLVEQILASHSHIHGAGELELIDDIIYQLKPATSQLKFPNWANEITSSNLQKQATQYLNEINNISPGTPYIINKMPHNFLHLGLIQQLFPKAKVIHCTRNPNDTLLSIYFHQFNSNHPYASDLSNLNFYYQQYIALMKHWEKELSIQIHTINYENIINNFDNECKTLIQFCNVEWQENCLSYYKNKRISNTPSYHQVRQPLYKNSITRSQHYKKYLTHPQ